MGQGSSQHLTHTCIVKIVQKSRYITWQGIQRKRGQEINREKERVKKHNSNKGKL